MKKILIPYWVFTGLLVALMGLGAIPDIIHLTDAVALFKHLGYPAYLLPFLGVAKLLGIVAILVPGFPRIKEWAYAGFVFDLSGAMYSNIAVDGLSSGLSFVIGYLMIAGSYVYYHKRQKSDLLNQTKQMKQADSAL